MGTDSFTIHPDGVIERGNELEPILLNILEVGSHKISAFAAYKAQKKCFKLAKKEREIDYKEYVERLQLDHYPKEFKKSELGRRLVFLLWIVIPILLLGIVFFVMGVILEFDTDGLVPGLIGIVLLLLSGLGIWRAAILIKRIKRMFDA